MPLFPLSMPIYASHHATPSIIYVLTSFFLYNLAYKRGTLPAADAISPLPSWEFSSVRDTISPSGPTSLSFWYWEPGRLRVTLILLMIIAGFLFCKLQLVPRDIPQHYWCWLRAQKCRLCPDASFVNSTLRPLTLPHAIYDHVSQFRQEMFRGESINFDDLRCHTDFAKWWAYLETFYWVSKLAQPRPCFSYDARHDALRHWYAISFWDAAFHCIRKIR